MENKNSNILSKIFKCVSRKGFGKNICNLLFGVNVFHLSFTHPIQHFSPFTSYKTYTLLRVLFAFSTNLPEPLFLISHPLE
jgi:hypothetical protein